jgi:hypothetical protein
LPAVPLASVHGSHDTPHSYGPRAILVDAGKRSRHITDDAGCLRHYALAQGSIRCSIRAAPALDRRCTRDASARRSATDRPVSRRAPMPTPTVRAHRHRVRPGLDHPGCVTPQFDLIIANILAGPLRMLAGEVSPPRQIRLSSASPSEAA